jgi:hypothetical protein
VKKVFAVSFGKNSKLCENRNPLMRDTKKRSVKFYSTFSSRTSHHHQRLCGGSMLLTKEHIFLSFSPCCVTIHILLNVTFPLISRTFSLSHSLAFPFMIFSQFLSLFRHIAADDKALVGENKNVKREKPKSFIRLQLLSFHKLIRCALSAFPF